MPIKEKHKIIGETYNPFTEKYENTYDVEGEKVWVAPDVKKVQFHTNYKAIVSGDVIEIFNYEEPVFYGYESFTSKGKTKIEGDGEKRGDSIIRSQMAIRRLINANVSPTSKFVTLTYSDNETDVKKAKDDFKKFMKRLNYYLKKLGRAPASYLYVVEFQKRGAVHFHCVFFNLGYIKNKELNALWQNGFVKINKIDNVDNVGAYVVKYMNKENDDKRLNNCDLYGRSRGLKEPREIKEPSEVCRLLKAYENHIVYSKTYDSDYKGKIEYCQINIKRAPKNSSIANG